MTKVYKNEFSCKKQIDFCKQFNRNVFQQEITGIRIFLPVF